MKLAAKERFLETREQFYDTSKKVYRPTVFNQHDVPASESKVSRNWVVENVDSDTQQSPPPTWAKTRSSSKLKASPYQSMYSSVSAFNPDLNKRSLSSL
jgi:hypothetical protein